MPVEVSCTTYSNGDFAIGVAMNAQITEEDQGGELIVPQFSFVLPGKGSFR